ncbi:CHAD domain-containing protein [Teichococcus aerofrigidensis]
MSSDPTPAPASPPAQPSLTLEATLPAGQAAALWRHPALAGLRRPRTVPEEWLWLDSAEGRLAEAGLALRASLRGPRDLCPLMPPEGPSAPGLSAGAPHPLPAEAVPDALEGAILLPRASYAGRTGRGSLGGIALRFRQGRLRAATATAPEAPFCGVTFSGPAPAVLDLVEALAETLPLLPAGASLDEQAFALARGGPARPRRRGAPDLGAVETVEAALPLAIGHLAEAILAQAPLCRPDLGPEGVHQSRVAARRLRSCLKTFRPLLDGPELRALDTALRDFARALGDAREMDVFLRGLASDLSRAVGQDRRWARLLRVAEGRRLDAYARLRTMLEDAPFRRMMWQATRLALLPPWRDAAPARPLRPEARHLLHRRRRKMIRRARHIDTLSDTELHELRLEAKRLRYTAELFAPLWPGKAARRFLKRLSELQEALGLSNDSVTARHLIAGLAEGGGASAWAGGLAEGWALAAARDSRAAALEAWRRFERQDTFWQGG